MIFPGFPGVLSFFQVFQVFQVEWEPWCLLLLSVNAPFRLKRGSHAYFQLQWLVPWKINNLITTATKSSCHVLAK